MKARWTRWFAVLALGSCGFLLSSCAPDPTMRIALYSYQISIDQAQFEAGPITLYITNYSEKQPHEIALFRTDTPAEFLPRTLVDTVNAAMINPISSKVDVMPGITRKQSVNLSAGHYIILCNLPGHYDQGMYAEFDVK
jgi:uncharacterized cupredoxin-like copper-binding protein